MWIDRGIRPFPDIKPVFPTRSSASQSSNYVLAALSPPETRLCLSATEVKRNLPQVRLARKARVCCSDSANRNIARGVKLSHPL